MKLRLVFTSGIASREVDTGDLTAEEFLFAKFGNRMNFENLGGKVEVLEESPAATPAKAPKKCEAKAEEQEG